MSENEEFYLSIDGSAPNGDGFSVSLHYSAPIETNWRLQKLADAAEKAACAVLLTRSDAISDLADAVSK